MQQMIVEDNNVTRLEEITHTIKRNLLEYNVTIGIVDQMSNSLELVQHLIDSEQEAKGVFRKYGLLEKEGSENGTKSNNKDNDIVMNNKSILSTSSIVKELRQDVVFLRRWQSTSSMRPRLPLLLRPY